jgi:hypothetical protein
LIEHGKKHIQNLRYFSLQINDQNAKYINGDSTYYEKLNENSDMPKSELQREREGAILPGKARSFSRGLGAVLPPSHEQETSEEWEETYRQLSRQTLPTTYNATAAGKYYVGNYRIDFVIIPVSQALCLR